jgi:hypothetical protein
MNNTIIRYIFFFFLCSFAITSKAQIGKQRNTWSVGVNLGSTLNKVDFIPSIKQNTQQGLTGGVTLRYISEKFFSMICGTQIEVNFAQKGWKENHQDDSYTYERSMNYIEIPFLVHLAFGKEKRGAQFFINAGPQINFLLSEKEKKGGNWENVSAPQYGYFADKKFDYGITGGAGLEIKTDIGNFLLEGRYYYGLSDFYNNTKKDQFDRSGHSTICIKASYLFDISK